MLTIGIKGSQIEIVTVEKAASALGSGGLNVYGTPAMIALMEGTALNSVQPFLEPGMTTVGTLVNIQHKAAVPIGSTVTCESELIEIDRKKLVFHVSVFDENVEVGSGLHERFIVNIERFLSKVQQKK